MSSIGTGYDLSATTFSPDGRVFQVEYAMKAVENSGTAVGLRCKDGVVLGVEKLIMSKLYEKDSGRRLFTVDGHVGMACAGFIADGRQIVNRARSEASNYKTNFGGQIPAKVLAKRVSSFVHLYTLYSQLRPFGNCMLLAAHESDGPQLFMVEPSGISWGYRGCAVGKGKSNAKTEIEKLKLEEMTVQEGVREVARIIHSVHDDVKDKPFRLEMSWASEATHGKHVPVPAAVIAEAEEYAKAALESDDEDD